MTRVHTTATSHMIYSMYDKCTNLEQKRQLQKSQMVTEGKERHFSICCVNEELNFGGLLLKAKKRESFSIRAQVYDIPDMLTLIETAPLHSSAENCTGRNVVHVRLC